MNRELEGLEKNPKARNAHQCTQNNTKNITNWKTQGHDGTPGF